jgi:hypothetical protein
LKHSTLEHAAVPLAALTFALKPFAPALASAHTVARKAAHTALAALGKKL